jgi:hypothetical protein
MRGKTYRVHLTAEEEMRLRDIISKGVHPARQITHARILLLLNEKTDGEGQPVRVPEQTDVAEQCGCHWIKDKLELHYTPKHGSWLNKGEIELSVINNPGLSQRIPAIEQMRKERAAWNLRRNEEACKIK